MVAQRRFLPLVGVLAVALLVIAARLFQVQVVEAATWGREAANLVRSSNVVPYHRGTIRDRNGVVLARDEDLYQVEFEYREFRRGHPLAQVAHARAALELAAVPLSDALDHLEEWGRALVAITPAELAAFARGEAVTLGGVAVAASADPELEQRARRAADVRWYIGELLHVAPRDARKVVIDADDPDRARPWIELVARRVRGSTAERALAELETDLAAARADLERLAALCGADLALLGAEPGDGAGSGDRAGSGAGAHALVAALERQRRAVEDASANAIFEAATGFGPGRIATASFEQAFDVRWIAALLRWDEARCRAWMRACRPAFEARMTTAVLPRLLARAAVEEKQGRKRAAARVLDGLAALYAPRGGRAPRRGDPPPSWTELDELAVLDELDTLFEGRRLPRDVREARALIALDDPELQDATEAEDPWLYLALVTELAGAHALDPRAPANAVEAGARWNAIAAHGLPPEDPEALEELAHVARALETRFQEAIARALLALAVEDVDGSAGGAAGHALRPMALARERIDRALQEERSIQMDQQSRRVLLSTRPAHELVLLLERFPERYRGFEVRESTRRAQALLASAENAGSRGAGPGDAASVLPLLGSVRKPSLPELFAQVRDERRSDRLRYQLTRSADEQRELLGLEARLFRADEWTGGAGLEDYFDPELRGRFGWREVQGLAGYQDHTLGVPPEDGDDLELALDLELQRAAQSVLEHPTLPADAKADVEWFKNPVGAIVLATVDGEVLAAASVPTTPGEPVPGRDRERSQVRERTLTLPTFNPPGSVFKPFVAAYALDRIRFEPRTSYACDPIDATGVGGHVDLHCNDLHGVSDLRRALTVSCNSYFAQLGECYTTPELEAMAHVFGFDEPTGVKLFGSTGRTGLIEHWRFAWTEDERRRLDTASGKRRFANGLVFVEATPMQVARALAGLATGWLPDMTLVHSIAGAPLPRRGRELGLSEASLAFVRRAMEAVVHEGEGSAHAKGLDPATLGFRIAAKTGSGDYAAIRQGADATAAELAAAANRRVRKHTWVGGWFPAEKPRAVFVVYLHDTLATSSHSAVYVAAEFLRQEAVKSWLARALAPEGAAATPSDARAPVAEAPR